MEGATRSLNYNDLVAAREEMVRSAAAATNRERSTFRVGASLPLGLPGDHDDDEGEGEQTHREYVVTDGRKTTTAPHLHGPNQETLLYQRFRQSIFQARPPPPAQRAVSSRRRPCLPFPPTAGHVGSAAGHWRVCERRARGIQSEVDVGRAGCLGGPQDRDPARAADGRVRAGVGLKD